MSLLLFAHSLYCDIKLRVVDGPSLESNRDQVLPADNLENAIKEIA